MTDKDTLGWLFRRPVKTLLAWLAAADPKPYPVDVERILVIREGGYGDLMLTMPIIRALRRRVGPNVTVDLLVREPVAGMMEDNGVTNLLFAKGPNILRTAPTIIAMRKRHYQVVIDLVSSSSLSFVLWILAIAPSAHRIGGDKAELRRMYHQHVDLPPRPSIHFMERLRRIAAFAIGDDPVQDQIPWFTWPESVRQQTDQVWNSLAPGPQKDKSSGGIVLVNLSAGLPRRTWPNELYCDLLSTLVPKYQDRIHRWILTASPGDQPRATALAAAINRPEIRILPLQSDFRVVAELTARVDLVLTPDTSILHAASASGVPVVAFTVAENIISWAPWKIPSAVVHAPTGLPVSAIPVEEVAAAFDRMIVALDSTPRPRSYPVRNQT